MMSDRLRMLRDLPGILAISGERFENGSGYRHAITERE
jgi:hypothetical protein